MIWLANQCFLVSESGGHVLFVPWDDPLANTDLQIGTIKVVTVHILQVYTDEKRGKKNIEKKRIEVIFH